MPLGDSGNGSTAWPAGPRRARLARVPGLPASSRRATASSSLAVPQGRARGAASRAAPGALPAAGRRARPDGRPLLPAAAPPSPPGHLRGAGGRLPVPRRRGPRLRGCLIGQDAWSGTAFCYDPWVLYQQGVLTNPNIFLAGQIGRGKSALAKSLACRCIAFGRRVYVPGDPKGEWTTVARAVGGQAVQLGIGRAARLNPLDEGPRPSGVGDSRLAAQGRGPPHGLLGALAEATLGRPLAPTERSALDAALADALRRASVPVLPMVVDALLEPTAPLPGHDHRAAASRRARGRPRPRPARPRRPRRPLRRPLHRRLRPGACPCSASTCRPISGSDTLIGLVMTCASTWMEAALADPGGGQRLVVYDEAWRLLAQPALLARMQAQWKLSRAWGLANLMVVHRLSDLDAVGDLGSQARGLAQGLLGDTATRILYNEPFDEAQAAGKLLGLTSVEIDQLPELAQGEGLWRVNERAFVVRHL